MRLRRVVGWLCIPVAILSAPILLVVLGESQDWARRQKALLDRFKTFDPAKAEKMMVDVEIPASFSSEAEIEKAVWELKVPGFGLSEKRNVQPDGSLILEYSIEIPGSGKDRGLIVRGIAGKFTKIDDFTYDSETYAIAEVRLSGNQPLYFERDGRPVPVKRIAAK
jgi:hypothetical protein